MRYGFNDEYLINRLNTLLTCNYLEKLAAYAVFCKFYDAK